MLSEDIVAPSGQLRMGARTFESLKSTSLSSLLELIKLSSLLTFAQKLVLYFLTLLYGSFCSI